jgi:hypothetical protein
MNFKKKMGAKNSRKNLDKHPGPPFQMRPGLVCFIIAENPVVVLAGRK